MSKLDTDKFRKVHVLITGGATEGERAAAKARAEAMAQRVGMTLVEALRAARPETEEERRRRESVEQWERERRAREAEAVRKYGPAELIFAESPEEVRLSAAVEAFKVWSTDPAFDPYVESLAGWRGDYGLASASDLPPRVAEAVRSALPWPSTVREAFNEMLRWHLLLQPRLAFDSDYHREPWVTAREEMVGELFWGLGASTLDDIAAREAWLAHRMDVGGWWGEDTIRIARRFRMDAEWVVHETLMRMLDRAPRATVPTTASERRRKAVSILDTSPDLSDREIARRCGVSPTTVGALRRQHGGGRNAA